MAEQQQRKFKVGDIVRLKTGGPAMTVRTPGRTRAESIAFSEVVVVCNYFEGSELKTVEAPEDALEATTPDTSGEAVLSGGRWPAIADGLLQHLVIIANRTDQAGNGTVWVTLFVGGLLVNGSITSGWAYFANLKKKFSVALPEGESAPFVQLMQPHQDDYPNAPDAPHTRADDEAPSYIHICNAQILPMAGGVRMVDADGLWWRGKLSAVDAFIFGKTSVSVSHG